MPKSETQKKKRKLSINGPTSQERRWQQLLEKWRFSGLPGTAFCRRRRLKESAFRFWQKEVPYRERRRQGGRHGTLMSWPWGVIISNRESENAT